jgi:Uma2 family endonuclease
MQNPEKTALITPDPLPDPEWEFPEPPTDLVFDDGEPLESNRHRIAMNVLIDSVLQAFPDREDIFTGGNMFVYYSREQAMNRDFRGPDFFAVTDVDSAKERQGWVVWEEQGRYPDVIVEFMSPSTKRVDKVTKKELYARTFRTFTYVIYDPFDPSSLEGWQLQGREYVPLEPNELGRLWCEPLGLWLGLWEGRLRREPATGTCDWLRFFDADGNLILLLDEVAEQERQRADAEQQRANAERQRADRLAERLRALGVDPDADE